MVFEVNRLLAKGALSFALTLSVLAASCGGDIATGIESANDLLYGKQYVESERLYRKLLRRLEAEAPNLDENEDQQRLLVLDRLGKLNALYLHDYDHAIRYYKQLVMMYPRSSQAFAGLATIADILQHKLGKHEAAIEAYQKMVNDFPPNEELGEQDTKLREQEQTRAQLRIANAYFALKNYEQARGEAEKLIQRWPKSSEAFQARFQIANSYYIEGRHAEAVGTYERLLEDEPEPELESLVLFELGNCFQELDEKERALAYYYGCLADHPDPLLVQRKIKRLRKRIGSAKPADSIHLPAYLQDRLAAARALPFGVTTATATKSSKSEAPSRNRRGASSGGSMVDGAFNRLTGNRVPTGAAANSGNSRSDSGGSATSRGSQKASGSSGSDEAASSSNASGGSGTRPAVGASSQKSANNVSPDTRSDSGSNPSGASSRGKPKNEPTKSDEDTVAKPKPKPVPPPEPPEPREEAPAKPAPKDDAPSKPAPKDDKDGSGDTAKTKPKRDPELSPPWPATGSDAP
ncbi:MAG: tetratricopeptide repeat protein [Myxococcota bacterium]